MGAAKLSGDTINYLGIEGFRVAGKQGISVIVACQLVLMGGPEYARSVGIKALEPVGIFLPGDTNYPGGASNFPFRWGGKSAVGAECGLIAPCAWAAQARPSIRLALERTQWLSRSKRCDRAAGSFFFLSSGRGAPAQ